MRALGAHCCGPSPSLLVEAERFDHAGLQLHAVLAPHQGKAATAAIDPGRPDEAALFGLLAHVTEPPRPLGAAGLGERALFLAGAELAQDHALWGHPVILGPTRNAVEGRCDRAAVEGRPAIAL